MNTDDLAALSQTIHNGWFGAGLPYFNKFWSDLSRFPASHVVSHQVKTFSLSFVTEFLLSTPLLLERLDTDEWIRVFRDSCPRPTPAPWDIKMEGQADVYFVCKYLRIDAVSVVAADPGDVRTRQANDRAKSTGYDDLP